MPTAIIAIRIHNAFNRDIRASVKNTIRCADFVTSISYRHRTGPETQTPFPMALDPRTLALITQRLDDAERNIQYVRQALEEGDNFDSASHEHTAPSASMPEGERIIEGVFDGQNMQGNDGEEYPVPPNYASKSKLVEGDVLKLTIETDGGLVYKQINPVERKRVVGTLVVDELGNFGVQTPEKTYKILLASVTFYKAQEGDEVTVLIPEHGEGDWGAVEHVIHH